MHDEYYPWGGVTRGATFIIEEVRWGARLFSKLKDLLGYDPLAQRTLEIERTLREVIQAARPDLEGCILYSAGLYLERKSPVSGRLTNELRVTVLHGSLPEWHAGRSIATTILDPPRIEALAHSLSLREFYELVTGRSVPPGMTPGQASDELMRREEEGTWRDRPPLL